MSGFIASWLAYFSFLRSQWKVFLLFAVVMFSYNHVRADILDEVINVPGFEQSR